MANFGEFEFTKDWKDSDDFPTREYSEDQVREDIQYLFDEIKDYLNTIVVAALSDHDTRIASLGGGGQVEHDIIADYAIEENNIADGSITELKYAQDSIPSGVLQDESVKSDNFDETVEPWVKNIADDAIEDVFNDLNDTSSTSDHARLMRALIIYVVSTTPLSEWWGVYD